MLITGYSLDRAIINENAAWEFGPPQAPRSYGAQTSVAHDGCVSRGSEACGWPANTESSHDPVGDGLFGTINKARL